MTSLIEVDIMTRVAKMMNWHWREAKRWYETENPNFGGVSPRFMVESGRAHKVVRFIETAEKDNFPAEEVQNESEFRD